MQKIDSGRGSTPDPAGGDHDAPPDPLVGCGADTPSHTHPTQRLLALRFSRLRRLVRRAPPPTPNPGDATGGTDLGMPAVDVLNIIHKGHHV